MAAIRLLEKSQVSAFHLERKKNSTNIFANIKTSETPEKTQVSKYAVIFKNHDTVSHVCDFGWMTGGSEG